MSEKRAINLKIGRLRVEYAANAELERTNAALAEAVRQKDALYQLTDRLQHAQSLDDVYNAALHAILSALPCDRASILLFDDGGVMRFVAWRGLSEAYRKVVEGHSPWSPDEKNPAPICIGDIETADLSDALKATVRSEGIGAAAFVPLVGNGRLIGKFMTYFNGPHVFGDDETGFSLNIARQLAFAIERRRADDALRESRKSLAEELAATQRLHVLSTELVQPHNIEGLYQQILDTAVALMRSDFASMQLFYPERGLGGELRLLAFRGFDPKAAKFWEWVRTDSQSVCGQALRTGARVVVADVEQCDFMAGSADLATSLQTGIRAVQTTLLFSRGGKMLGMISTHWREPHQPSERDLRLLDILARQAADLIERKQAEQALRDSEERFRAIVSQAAAGVAQTDLTGKFTFVNDRYCELVGYTREELLQRRVQDVTHPEDLAPCLEQFERLLNTGQNFVIEKRFRRKDGTIVWVSNSVTAIQDAEGRTQSIAGVTVDITERKQVEAVLREADRRKDEFLATLSHELRNPLAPIRQAASLLKVPGLGERDAHWARDVIDRQVRAMGWLLDDLLDLSRISRGKLELRKEPVGLASVVESALELARPLIEAKRHALQVELPASIVRIEADPLRLSQIISNLLTNAAKYTDPQGKIRLWAGQEGEELLIRVTDNGIGIGADMLPKVFDMFSQATPALERNEGGLGIGLALVRGFVALHGGSVQACSEGLGRGSEFTLRLPIGNVSSDQPRSQPGTPDVQAVTSCKVLVVDDNRDTAETLARLIKLQGYDVQVSFNGREALEVAENFHPDIVLLDIGMPELNGYEIAQHIRKRLWGQRITLIAVTGWGQEDDRRRAIAAGFDYHLRKPIDPDFLKSLLKDPRVKSAPPGARSAAPEASERFACP